MSAGYDKALQIGSALTRQSFGKPIEVELYDGEVITLPAGTSPEIVDQIAKEQTAYHKSQQGVGATVNQFAAGFNRAALALPMKLAEQGAAGLEALYPAEKLKAQLPESLSRALESGSNAAMGFLDHVRGADTPPVDTVGRIANTTGGVAGTVLPITGGMVAGAPRVAAMTEGSQGIVPGAINTLAKSVARNPVKTAAVDAGLSVTSGIGGGVAGEAFPGNHTAEAIGMLLGGFAPAGIGAAARLSPTRLVTRPAFNAASRAAAEVPENVRSRIPFANALAARGSRLNTADALQARKDVIGGALDDTAQANLARAEELRRDIPGFNPTLAEATGSQSLARTQEGIESRASGAELEGFAGRRAASESAISDFARRSAPEGEGGAEFVVDNATRRVDRLRSGVSQQAMRAGEYGAENIAGAIPRIDRAEIGSSLRDMVNDARRSTSAEMSALSKRLGLDTAGVSVPFNRFRDEVKAEFTPGSVFEDTANYPRVVQSILDNKSGTISFKDLKSLRERISDDIIDAQASPIGRNQKIRMLTTLKRKVDALMEQIAAEGMFVPSGARQVLDIAKRLRRTTGPKGEDLTSYVIRSGGLREDGGELANMGISARARPGLLNKGGRTLDDAAYTAWEAGFFPGKMDRPDVNEFLEALRGDFSGLSKRFRVDDAEAGMNAELRSWDEAFNQQGIDWRNTPDNVLEEQILKQFGTAPEGVADLVQKYRTFLKTYREQLIDRFEHGVIHKIRQRDGTGYYRVPDEEVAGSFFEAGNVSAARQFKQVFKNDPTAMDSLQAAVLDDLRQFAVRDGKLVQGALQGWLRRHASVLDEFPSIKRAVGVFNQAEAALLARQTQLKARADRIESQLLVRDLAKVQKGSMAPERLIESALNDPRKMAELRRAVRGPDALAALRRHVWDGVADKSAGDIEKFLNKHAKSLGEVFDSRHLGDLKRIAQARKMLEGVQPPQGQGVRADPLKAIQDAIGMGIPQLASRGFAAQSGRTSWKYVATDAFGRFFRARRMQEMDKLMREAIYNPDVARDLASMAGSPSISAEARKRLNFWLFNAGLNAIDDDND